MLSPRMLWRRTRFAQRSRCVQDSPCCSISTLTVPPQAYRAHAQELINTARDASPHAPKTVVKALNTLRYLLGFAGNVARRPSGWSTLAVVLDGPLMAQFVRFGLEVRCVKAMRIAQRPQLLTSPLCRRTTPSTQASYISDMLALLAFAQRSLTEEERRHAEELRVRGL